MPASTRPYPKLISTILKLELTGLKIKMNSKIKNIIIISVVAVLLILIYIFFIKPAPAEQNLVSSASQSAVSGDTTIPDQNSLISKDFLSLLLSVKSIKLDDSIFSDGAFLNLKDSTISLTPTGDEGRPNPFAPIGFDAVVAPPPANTVVSPVIPPVHP
jgi:hypothetical protein